MDILIFLCLNWPLVVVVGGIFVLWSGSVQYHDAKFSTMRKPKKELQPHDPARVMRERSAIKLIGAGLLMVILGLASRFLFSF